RLACVEIGHPCQRAGSMVGEYEPGRALPEGLVNVGKPAGVGSGEGADGAIHVLGQDAAAMIENGASTLQGAGPVGQPELTVRRRACRGLCQGSRRLGGKRQELVWT